MRRAANVLVGGFVCGLVAIVLALGTASLLSSGDLAPYLPVLAGCALVAAAVMPLATAFLSALPGQVTTTQEIGVVALAAVVGGAVTSLAANGNPDALLPTVIVAFGLTTALSGLAMVLLGTFRLGRIVRFVPYPVFGGFLAITGWALFTGGIEASTGRTLDLTVFQHAFDQTIWPKLLFSAAIAGLLFRFSRSWGGVMLPLLVVVVVVGFNLVVTLAGIPASYLQSLGWTYAVPPDGVMWPPIDVAGFAAIDWRAVLAAMLFVPFAVTIITAAAMMNVSGLEIETGEDIDLNRELRSMGVGNVLAGLAGGVPGFPALSATLLGRRIAGSSRIVSFLTGIVCLVAVVYAQPLLAVVPAPLLGALLIWLGGALLIDWVVKPFKRLTRGEYAIIVLILLTSIVLGTPAGILTGLAAALGLFVVQYSAADSQRFLVSGRHFHSGQTSGERLAALEQMGGAILIAKLSGFIFFGTSDRLLRQLIDGINASSTPIRFVELDFRRVTGIDSSAVMSFRRLERIARQRGFIIILASLKPAERERLQLGGLDLAGPLFRLEPDLDAGLIWAEDQLLIDQPAKPEADQQATDPRLRYFGDAGAAALDFLETVTLQPGDRLIEQGARSDDLYFIQAGEGEVLLEFPGAIPVRLMRFGPGAIVGEVAFYRREPRSASVVASTEMTALRLTRETLARLETEHPEIALSFHRAMAKMLADRLQSANAMVRVLAD